MEIVFSLPLNWQLILLVENTHSITVLIFVLLLFFLLLLLLGVADFHKTVLFPL